MSAASGGAINDLLASAQVTPYLQILLENSQIPMVDKVQKGPRVPISESPRDVEGAIDISELPRFIPNGKPFALLLPEIAQGNVMRWKFHDTEESPAAREMKPRIAHYIGIDISGSMGAANKWIIRNLLLNTYIDYYTRKMAAEEEDHVFYLIYFEGKPHREQIYRGISQIQNLFASLRSAPAGSGGGTDITAFWLKSLQLINSEIKQNGALDAANTLLLSDGIADINESALIAERQKIPKDVRLAFNAISIYDTNPVIETLVKKLSSNPTTLGKMAYHHIDDKSIQHLMNYPERYKNLAAMAADDNNAKNDKVPFLDIARLTQMLNSIPNEKKMEAHLKAEHKKRILDYLTPENMAKRNSLDSLEKLWNVYFKFYDTAHITKEEWEIESLITFINTVCNAAQVSPQQVFSSLKNDHKERVLQWLK